MKKIFTILILSLFLFGLATPIFADQKVDVVGELESIRKLLDQSVKEYKAGKQDAAYDKAVSAYLDHFELVEIPLRAVENDFTLEMEYRFADLRSKIKEGGSARDIAKQAGLINEGLVRVEKKFSTPGAIAPSLAFLASFSIIFREGVEAILILATLVAYLVSSRNQRLLKYVYWGMGLAAVASFGTWFLASYIISITPLGRELLEAVITLSAVAVLFYMSFWLTRRLEQKRWMEFIKAKTWSAASAGNVAAMVGLSFTIIYREGFETILFYQALTFSALEMTSWIVYGFLAGVAILIGLGVAVFGFGLRIPAKAFLGTAVIVIMAFSVTFLGNAISELQSAAIIPMTSLYGKVPKIPVFLAELVGFHPTVETIGAQILLALTYMTGGFLMLKKINFRKPKASSESGT